MESFDQTYINLISNIKCNSNQAKSMPITDDEEKFIKALIAACNKIHMVSCLKLERLSNGTFNVWCNRYVGKIKLHGKKTYMQILKGKYGIRTIENCSFNEYLSNISKWISYIVYCNK